jgi:hypothetical protein
MADKTMKNQNTPERGFCISIKAINMEYNRSAINGDEILYI